ncbi:hypothetical protein K8W59_06045 [Nocardioides rotundus]|uniref:hypothetical protein n=1 Tax=Nocardioides rotundus TaxID=1774216 RepID=UPI001CC0E026|nr:hypothetical protein [Nocardioides rotundus]UAL31047.1 hypothetical protein K8W59_06045 [Nocardioides rotundus]
MNKRVIGAALLGLVLPLSACGNGDDEKAAQAISKQMQDGGDSDFSVKKSEADCVGEGFVSEIGTEQLQKYKIITSDLKANNDVGNVKMSKDDAESAASVFQDCTDVKAMMVKGFESQGMPKDAQKCVEKELTDERLNSFLVDQFQGKSTAGQDLGQALQSCVTSG